MKKYHNVKLSKFEIEYINRTRKKVKMTQSEFILFVTKLEVRRTHPDLDLGKFTTKEARAARRLGYNK